MIRSRQRHLSLESGEVVDHTVPILALAELLIEWDAALRAALPQLVVTVGLTGEAAREVLSTVQPVTSAPQPGSVRAPYGYAVIAPSPQLAFLPGVPVTALDSMVETFEAGVVALQTERNIPDWMTPEAARGILGALSKTGKRGIRVMLPDSNGLVLAEEAETVLQQFIQAEEHGRESEIQIIGYITSVNVAQGNLVVDSTGHGRVRLTLPQSERRAICQAMAEGEAVEVIVQAGLSSDGTLHHAKLRSFRNLGARPNYELLFQELWGTARDVFADVPRDERGIPDPDAN